RPLIAVDPGGEDLRRGAIPPRAILAFGTERHGLSDAVLEHAEARVGIPMRDGVSSLNLATSVAVALFSQRV
ncbi:MAG TPA: TrmH family RNA methyltransferase, partial [Solirubrobacterales bacterium]|nr:TrmH family RNA methyltransferase [Solirubrobacterales bacterium]